METSIPSEMPQPYSYCRIFFGFPPELPKWNGQVLDFIEKVTKFVDTFHYNKLIMGTTPLAYELMLARDQLSGLSACCWKLVQMHLN